LEQLYEIVEEMKKRLETFPDVLVTGYGHVSDGNLHLNISNPKWDSRLEQAIEPFVYEWTRDHEGSVSAEHGLRLMKADCIHYSKPKNAVKLMKEIKKTLDPKGILNPYKVLPETKLE